MTPSPFAMVWLDHHEARIVHVDASSFDASAIHSPHHHLHRHQKGASEGHVHPDDLTHFFQEIVQALSGSERILLVGPSTAKLQFLRYLHEHAKNVESKVVGVETSDHPTSAQLVAHAKAYFDVAPPRLT